MDNQLKLTDTIEAYGMVALERAQVVFGNRKVEIPHFTQLFVKVARANKSYYVDCIPQGKPFPICLPSVLFAALLPLGRKENVRQTEGEDREKPSKQTFAP